MHKEETGAAASESQPVSSARGAPERVAIEVDDVVRLIEKQLGSKAPPPGVITGGSVLEELGLSSLDLTEVFFSVEEHVGFELDPTDAADAETVDDLVAIVRHQATQRSAMV